MSILPLPDILSFIFLMTSAGYFLFGLLVLSFNDKSILHRVLSCSFFILSWWAFAFTVANNALDHDTALLWRRLASVGWGIYYSLFLHFILILTERRALLRKYWLYLLLYLPAALNVFLYGIYDRTALLSYLLVRDLTGWVNIAGITALDMVHIVSYTGLTLAGVLLLYHWGVSATDGKKRKTAMIIGIFTLAALIIGTLTEHVINAVFRINSPQIGPIVVLIPALAMFYCIRKYGMMRKAPQDAESAENQMLSEYAQSKVYIFISMVLFFCGFVGFAVLYYTNRASLAEAKLYGCTFTIVGVLIYTIRNLRIKTDLKDAVVCIVLAITLPAQAALLHRYTGLFSWSLPIFSILTAVTFNRRKFIILLGLSALCSYLWAWSRVPDLPVIFTGTYYAARIAEMAVMVILIFFYNNIFKRAILDSQEKASCEKLLSDVASMLMTVNERNFGSKIREVMARIGVQLQADRVSIIFLGDGPGIFKKIFEWYDPVIKNISVVRPVKIDDLTRRIIGLRHLWDGEYEDLAQTKPWVEREADKKWAEKIKSGALQVIPLKFANKLIGIIVLQNISGRTVRLAGISYGIMARMITNVWLRMEADRELRHKAFHDSLTGLPNKQYFTDRLKQAVNMAARANKLVGVLFLDIDSFKLVNDTIGHSGGDLFLMQIGRMIRESVREYDVVARFGGDEFLVMVPQADDIGGIEKVALKVMENMSRPVAISGQEFLISASMGIAVFPADGEEPETLIKNADIAMYVSKEIGRNRYTFCSANIKKDSYVNITLINDLNWALERNEMVLYYQPLLETASGDIIGVEALLRWLHPHLGMIAPSVFVPLAEKSGQIGNIGRWAINQACLQNKMWQEEGLKPITTAVNLSLAQLLDVHFVEVVHEAIMKSGLSPEFLELEITESTAAYDVNSIAHTLDRLKSLGAGISIDDFGSGYSFFERFRDLPVDKLKIDMRFIHGIGTDSKDEEIIKVIIHLGKAFNIRVLAEGVENGRQLAFLRENSCDEVQGYYFYKPMPAEEMREVLSKLTNQSGIPT